MLKKRILAALASCLMAGALLVGCGDQSANTSEPANVKIGMIAGLNVSEQRLNETMHKLEEISGIQMMSHTYVYYDSMNAMQMGLDAKDIDEISTYSNVAKYMIGRKSNLEVIDAHKIQMPMSDNFCCAVKADRSELLDALNSAIKGMKDDGTFDKLTKQFIADQNDGAEPDAVEMPMIEGAETIKVAVTGDLPPLDLITADGKPAGFNTAVLAEIGKRISKNIELVSIESAARASALTSGAVDVVFWMRVTENSDMFPIDFDRPDGVDVTESYFSDEIVHIGMKK